MQVHYIQYENSQNILHIFNCYSKSSLLGTNSLNALLSKKIPSMLSKLENNKTKKLFSTLHFPI